MRNKPETALEASERLKEEQRLADAALKEDVRARVAAALRSAGATVGSITSTVMVDRDRGQIVVVANAVFPLAVKQ